jgi:hypothetical protein
MTIHGAQWGFLAKLLYKFFRPELEKIVKDSTNPVDDVVLKVADKLAGE